MPFTLQPKSASLVPAMIQMILQAQNQTRPVVQPQAIRSARHRWIHKCKRNSKRSTASRYSSTMVLPNFIGGVGRMEPRRLP